MYKFNYIKVETIEEASSALSKNPEAKILAGGMTLIPTMKQRLASPEQLIDIRQVGELKFIKNELMLNINFFSKKREIKLNSSSNIQLILLKKYLKKTNKLSPIIRSEKTIVCRPNC